MIDTIYDVLYILRSTAEISLYLVGISALKVYMRRD